MFISAIKADLEAVCDEVELYVQAKGLNPVRAREVLCNAFAPASSRRAESLLTARSSAEHLATTTDSTRHRVRTERGKVSQLIVSARNRRGIGNE